MHPNGGHGIEQHTINMQQHPAERDIIPAIGIDIIPPTRDVIPTHIAGSSIATGPATGNNPIVNAPSAIPSVQIHPIYSGAKRSVIGKARIPIMIHASISDNVRKNPGHAINSPIMQ